MEGEKAKVYLDLALLTDPEDGDYYIEPPSVYVAPGTVNDQGLFLP